MEEAWGSIPHSSTTFVFGSLYNFGTFNADPLPGNYLFHDDGTVTFLDFGCVNRFSPEPVDVMHRISQSVSRTSTPRRCSDASRTSGASRAGASSTAAGLRLAGSHLGPGRGAEPSTSRPSSQPV
ncbi:MAG: AarF/UbiB family protein [Euzebya sp.]